eukprot:TRINITY_DN95150_c0_g1_i1.p1 TRINITY_DN95150_c0_g1~~TRINITY_DN95150_c0_g1_i1.p1  ORF type:complete len:409 (-),score=62.13 TRINITY_DN95150_c0_g1_i1:415-1641(-)
MPPPRKNDKYYPGSPWGDKPPDEVAVPANVYCGDRSDPRVVAAPVRSVTTIQGLNGPIVEREAAGCPVLHMPRDAIKHVDAYFEYRQLVGDSDDGKLLGEKEYEALREKAADPSRRLWVYWVESSSGLECKAVGPASMCFCGHRYKEHAWAEYPETNKLGCKMRGCACSAFTYVPVKGSGDLKCSACRQSFLDHDPRTKKCKKAGKGTTFASSYSCSCNSTYDQHHTTVQTNAERRASGKATGTPWMEAAVGAGLPTAHMGGIGGFAFLADGIDRAMAGLEPGFEPQRVYDSLAGDRHGIAGMAQQRPQQRALPGNDRSLHAYSSSASSSGVRMRSNSPFRAAEDIIGGRVAGSGSGTGRSPANQARYLGNSGGFDQTGPQGSSYSSIHGSGGSSQVRPPMPRGSRKS